MTGTRIKGKDLQAESPLVTVDSTQLEQRSELNIESYLNQLPQYNPAQTPTTENEDVQPSATNTVGISTISLYGLGPNRGLVLIDGHRSVPVNALGVTDVNSIPTAMIDRVEIITGGASAVYGADAMSGVTNFILKKSFQGVQVDVQDSETEVGDGNELRVSTLMGTKFADGKGNLIGGLEYYNRQAAYQANRSFFTNAWTNPTVPAGNAFFANQGYNGYVTEAAAIPNLGAVTALFPQRAANYGSILGFGSTGIGTYNFNHNNGSLWTLAGPIGTSGYQGPTSSGGYGLYNTYNSTEGTFNGVSPLPTTDQQLKWSNPLATVQLPQKRYSFFMNGTYDITDDIQFYTNARFAESLTTTLLDTPITGSGGWDVNIPFNAATDSPINPTAVNNILAMPSTTAAQQAAQQAAFKNLATSFAANPTSTNANYNPGYKGLGAGGVGHPVPWQLGLLLDSRGYNGVPGATNAATAASIAAANYNSPLKGGAPGCFAELAPSLCDSQVADTSSWSLSYLPFNGLPQRSTVEDSETFQVETGLKFPLGFKDWTGDAYYSHGESLNYEQGLGNPNLQQLRAEMQAPGYGQGLAFSGASPPLANYNSVNPGFGVTVPSTCSSGWSNAIFGADAQPTTDCLNGVETELQTLTLTRQDNAELDLTGTLFKIPTGDVSGALGYEWRREEAEFQPDNLQSSNIFLTQAIGLYPQNSLLPNDGLTFNDFYVEAIAPLVKDLGFLKKANLDIAGRVSDSDVTGSTTTFKVNMDAQLGQSIHLRGGFNRAERSPNLGELYLGPQELFGGGAQFGDPCSVRSLASFGAGGAAPDYSATTNGPTTIAPGQTAAGAKSTYLICQAQMEAAGGDAARNFYYGTSAAQAQVSQSGASNAGFFAWLNEEGNPNLKPETSSTWTGGFAFSNLGDNPWVAGISGSLDWWQIRIDNAIELDSPDYANFQCYGTNIVTTAAQAATQAATPACENVGRLAASGGAATALLTYTNQATIEESGINLTLNWIAQLKDLGLNVPGAITFNTTDENLNYFRTKTSPASFDLTTNWKGSFGPTLQGTDGPAYSYRLTATVGYQHPDFGVQLHWIFYPSTVSTTIASNNAAIAHDDQVVASGNGQLVGYSPTNVLATPAYSLFNLSGNWTVNKWLEIRGGIDNLFNIDPALTGLSTGYPTGTNLNAQCSAAAAKAGCQTFTLGYSLANSSAGITNPGIYDVLGRRYFVGFKATF